MRRLILLMMFLAVTNSAYAGIDNTNAIKALIGEACGQGDKELQAHAYVLKNRGTLRGVYGLHSKQVAKASGETWQRASKAWNIALEDHSDPFGGRTEWRSLYDLKIMAKRGETPKSHGLYDPLRVGDTFFYKLEGRK